MSPEQLLASAVLDSEDPRRVFDQVTPFTVGLEEEAMLVDATTLDLLPLGELVLYRLAGDPRFKRELPAAQIELVTAPRTRAADAIALLGSARRDLAFAAADVGRLLAAGVHPFAAAEGELNSGGRYDHAVERYGVVTRRQLVAALQVHVAVGGAERTVAVHDALRCFLPELAAMAANAPYHEGRDTGLASIRPLLCQQLPRQGVPPALGSWDALAAELAWGRRAGVVPEPAVWWWELRPHLTHGTLELRVPDAQTTLSEAAGITATIQALVAWLAGLHDAPATELPSAPDWRIAENRWSALRYGVDGEMADLRTGERQPTVARLRQLLDTLSPVFEQLNASSLLRHARALAERGGASRQRAIAGADGDTRRLTSWLADQYERPLG